MGRRDLGVVANNNREKMQAMADGIPLVAPVLASRSAQ
jgi:hypothetical protein